MSSVTRSERLDLRLPADVKAQIEKAAALCGQTLSNFVLGATTRHAREVIQEAEEIQLTDRDRDCLMAALGDTRAEPGPALKRAAARYKTMVE